MKFFSVILIVLFSALSQAEKLRAADPLHAQREVLTALYKQANIDPDKIEIILFQYDYMKGHWHIELSPKKRDCIDCYPSYYLKNKEKLILEYVPHG